MSEEAPAAAAPPAAAPAPAPAKAEKPKPIPPLDPTKPIPKVFQRFDGGDTPGFLRIYEDETPEKIDLRTIVEDTELSIDQLKGEMNINCRLELFKNFLQ